MERKDKNVPFSEASILLQPPNLMLSLASESPVLMPVAAVLKEDMQNSSSNQNTGSNMTDLSSKSSATVSSPLSQLEQPLLVRKPPSNPTPYMPPPPNLHAAGSNLQAAGSNLHAAGSNVHAAGSNVHAAGSNVHAAGSNVHAAGYPLEHAHDILPPPMYNPTLEQRPTETYIDAPNTVKSNWQADQSIYPPGISGSTYCDVTRSYTEPMFMEPSSSAFPSTFPDVRTASVPSSPSDYNNYGLISFYPIKPHWLFKDTVENKEVWYGFSEIDNEYLETAFQKDSQNIVPTDGGRYDVFIDARQKRSVYFDAKDLEVRRSTWFYQISSSSRHKPYAEEVAKTLEKQYSHCYTSKQWQRRFNVPGVGSFSFENPEVMFQFKDDLEVWPTLPDSKTSSIIVKRGLPDGFEILPSEHTNIDHLVFIVQGIGSFCDLRFRTVSQCVDGFRDIANKLISSHFKREVEQREVGRIEFLPVAWHSKLHVGLDRRMKNITLPSIPKLRHFTNDTLLDILYYSTPTYCQSIIDTVAHELNQMYKLFLERNPDFKGKVFVSGHSLGSLILFDILANQHESTPKSNSPDFLPTFTDMQSLLKHLDLEDHLETFSEQEMSIEALNQLSEEELISRGIPNDAFKKLLNFLQPKKNELKNVGVSADLTCDEQYKTVHNELVNQNDVTFPYGSPNNGMSLIDYPSLQFSPAGFFALGSPIAMFLSVRGYHRISEDFAFPTCPALFHIFHPYDPVAFRIEPLIDPDFSENPVLIPHHKGRKRLHLEIRENVSKFASEIKQKVTETMRFTWNSLNEFAKNYSFPSAMVTAEVDKLLELKMSETEEAESFGMSKEDIKIGCLNGGRRIDFVLQEKPIEALNDYVFALTSHATYWDSEDTVLLILREIYAMQGITMSTYQTDSKVPADNLPTLFQVPANNPSLQAVSSQSAYDAMNDQLLNVDLASNKSSEFVASTTIPSVINTIQPVVDYSKPNASSTVLGTTENIGPPPLSGFVKRSPFMH